MRRSLAPQVAQATGDGAGHQAADERQRDREHSRIVIAASLYGKVAGTGAGSYYGAFIRYRSPGDAFFDHAHNDYAETAANLGIVLTTPP